MRGHVPLGIAVVLVLLSGGPAAPGTPHGPSLPAERSSAGAPAAVSFVGVPLSPSASGAGNRSVSWGVAFEPGFGANFSLALSVELALPTGTVAPGEPYSGAVVLTTSGNASLSLRALGQNLTMSIPALGSGTPVPIPGANRTLDGVVLQVYAELATNISARCVTVPEGLGCPPAFTWNASGRRAVQLAPPASASAGSSWNFSLENISLAVSVQLTAEGNVPFVGNISEPIGSPLELAQLPGSPSTLSSNISVAAPLELAGVSVAPDPVAPNASYTVTSNATGGVGPLGFNYTTLPPGCVAADRPELVCTAPGAGEYPINVTVRSADGTAVRGTAELHVVAAPVPGPQASGAAGTGSSVPITWIVGAVALAAAAAAVGLVVGRGRRARPRP